jgi:hypothetical protein
VAGSGILGRIQELSEERERLVRAEADHGGRHEGQDVSQRIARVDHDLEVLWDLRRRELAGERVDLREDYYDRYVTDPGDDPPDSYGGFRP